MIERAFAVAMLALMVSSSAWAQEAQKADDQTGYSKAYDDCMEKSNGITVEVRDCIDEEYERLDKELNAVYGDLSAKSTPAARRALVASERAWLAFRRAQCDYEAHADYGGTLSLVLVDGCHLDMLARRVKEIRGYVESKHGFRSED
jgi:uncharacterized protein YecT (DUF1311 family)